MPQYFSPVPAFLSSSFFFSSPLRPSKDIISKCVFPSSPPQPTDGAHLLHPKTNLYPKKKGQEGKMRVDDIRGEKVAALMGNIAQKVTKIPRKKAAAFVFPPFSRFFFVFLGFLSVCT